MNNFAILYDVDADGVRVLNFETRIEAAKAIKEAAEPSGVLVLTIDDLKAVPGATLVAIYNRARPDKPVKRFATKLAAARRVFDVLVDAVIKPSTGSAEPAGETTKSRRSGNRTVRANATYEAIGEIPKYRDGSVRAAGVACVVSGKTHAEICKIDKRYGSVIAWCLRHELVREIPGASDAG